MIAQMLLPEVDHEIASTRKVLERVPAEHADWRPHPKSFTLGQLATHVANLFHWAVMTMDGEGFDVMSQPQRGAFTTTEELLARFEETSSRARAVIANATDEDYHVPWTLRAGERVIFTLPRIGVLRSSFLNHLIHHRGQLTVYLRMKDIPLPGLYGPSADEGVI